MVESILKWLEHVKRRHVDFVVRRVNQMDRSQIVRGRDRPKKNYTKSYYEVSRDK
jgi:hypothetical protein